MRLKDNLTRSWLLVFAIMLFAQYAKADANSSIITILDGSLNQIAKDSSATSKDSLFFSPSFAPNLVKPYPIQDVITFHINELSHLVLPSSFTAVVHLRVIYTDANSHVDSLSDLRLSINYRADSAYTARANFIFSGAYKVTVRVLSDTLSSPVIAALMIDNEIIPDYVYTYGCSGKDITRINSSLLSPDKLNLSWSNIIGADEYDLEWTYIDSSALASGIYTVSGSVDPTLVFSNNATRVSISDLNYGIPMIFPGAGALFARVRSVHYDKGQRIVSNWSSNYTNGFLRYDFIGHEDSLNWQSYVSFSEDGKRKIVVQYYDGSLRSRQTVAKDAGANKVLAAETIYDYQGRPAIQVLPAPTLDNIVEFTDNFNRINGAEYDKSNFDSIISPKTVCSMTTPAMDSNYGAAMYYSANNPIVNQGFNLFTPKSYGYAFSQTDYTPDNTGRISRQGGVGPEFQINSGHETRYYYAITPDQNELDALFGTEAGDHTHYFKNAVRDPNGQYSISYVDMHGRTIATALAGDAPAGLTALDSNVPSTVTETLADASTNVTDGLSMISHKSMFVEKSGQQIFQYALNPQTFQLKGCDSASICYDCMYDLTITISDDCGNHSFGGHPLVLTKSNVSVADALCNADGLVLSDTLTLDEGNYEITKTLTVNNAAENDYRNNVFFPHNVCKTSADFISFQEEALPHGNCNLTCESCRASIGSYSDFAMQYMTHVYGDTTGTVSHQAEIQTAYNNALASCDAYCDDTLTSQTNYVRQAMLLDMSPESGQYADLDSAHDIYSVFYTNNGTQLPLYQQVTGYVNEEGQPDSVWDNLTGQKVPPQKLDSLQFAEDFKPSWAETLLPYHPEYCKLLSYDSLFPSYNWDKKFLAITSYSDAISKGFDDPLAAGINQDPLSDNAGFGSDLSSKYNEYLSVTMGGSTVHLTMWQTAILRTKCPTGDSDCLRGIVFDDGSDKYALNCSADSDAAWQNFQQLYTAYKNELLNEHFANLACMLNGNNITGQDLVDDHHYLNFNTSGSLLADAGLGFTSSTDVQLIKDSADAKMHGYYESNCDSYDSLWAQELSTGYQPGQISALLPLLNQVCVLGADQNHPFGSRSISPDSARLNVTINSKPYSLGSFDDIINSYNDAYTISRSITKTADVLTLPGPYSSIPVYNQTAVSRPDASECSEISSYFSLYQINAENGETFSQYLKRTTNTDISDGDLSALQASCADHTDTCNFLDHPVTLPPIFQDSAQSPCTDCYAFNILVDQYVSEYGDTAYPKITDQTDTLQQRKNQLFASFMNNQLGYDLTPAEYMGFLTQCKNFTSCVSSDVHPNYDDGCQPHSFSFQMPQIIGPHTIYKHHFDSCATTYPYNVNADVSASLTNDSHWTNSYGSWSSCAGFTGQALQINSAIQDTASLTLNFHLDSGTAIDAYSYNFYNRTSDSGYRYWNMTINGRDVGGGNLFWDSTNTYALRPITKHWIDDDEDDTGSITVVIKLFGGLHGQSGTFSFDDFGIYGDGDWSNSSDSTGEDSTRILYTKTSATQVIKAPHVGSDTVIVSNGTYASCSDFGVGLSSAASDTTTVTFSMNIDSGYTAKVSSIQFSLNNVYNTGYRFWSMCVNGKFVTQDTVTSYYSGTYGSVGGNYLTYNPVDNIAGQVNVTIKFFGGVHNPSSSLCILSFYLYGKIEQAGPGDDTVYAGPPELCGHSQPVYPVAQLNEITSCTDSTFYAVSTGTEMYNTYIDSAKNNFDSVYHAKCLNAYNYETFTVSHTVDEYHYTLYYYDQAGNLVQTIPPVAVHPNWNSTYLSQVKTKRAAGDTLRPGHNLALATQYRYNTLNQVVTQSSPDGGTSHFYYDRLGRLVLSQNAKQSPDHKFSYTNYDPIGRITEVGELTNPSTMNSGISKTPAQLESWLNDANSSRTQITQTTYDTVYFGIDSVVMVAKNLRNRVSYMQYFNSASDQTNAKPQAGTYYSYDIEGNADTVVQDYTIPTLPSNANRFFKKIVYQYDLVSGKVNAVDYNPGQPDAFHHRYTYDGDNRITNVETSTDSIYWENEALYKYYAHGPIGRTVIGEQQVQGIDYAYTLQGWLKGVNSTNIGTSFDMGQDGITSTRIDVARDVFGFALHYFSTDYTAIKDNKMPFASMNTTVLSSFKPLYNGNIAAVSENLSSFTKPLLFNYGYDQLNRLIQMRTFKNSSTGFSATNNLWSPTAVNDYNEDVTYDANGNILKYKRYGNSTNTGLTNALLMDSLNYKYQTNTNKLDWIKDTVANSRFSVDIDNQASGNYRYDSIGDLITDSTGGIDSINWSVYGKIQKINKHDGSVINYYYDASGNRIGKVITGALNGNGETWYVHDASGNVMTVYSLHDNSVNSGALTLSEENIYGSSRLGLYKPNLNLTAYTTPDSTYMNSLGNVGYYSTFIRGKKFFELSNHLGNVLATISDKKLGIDGGGNDGIVDYFNADVISASDYYPFGMEMPGRDTTFKNSYRYGFNGKEMDNEPYGQGNEYDYGMRIYNPRIGRFLSVDPASKSFPWYSAYQFAGNKPVWCVDLDGQEETLITAVKAIWGDIENWWNAPTGAGQKITGQGAAIELGYPDYVPQTNGDWMWTISGQSLKAYNEYGSFQMYSEVEGVNSNIYSGSKVNTNIAPQQPSTTEEAPTGSTQIKIQNSSNVTSNSQTVEANDGNPNGIENNTVATNTQSQKKLQVGSYGNMKKANVKTGLSADHIPSFASLRSNLEQQLGRTLTATEATQLKNTSLTLVYETTIHQEFSRTYGGRNNPLKIGIDMQDLVGAVENDINALRPALLKAGYSAQDINAATEQLKSKYKLK